MFVSLPESNGNLVCFKAVGKLTAEDYQSMMEQFHTILDIHGSLRLYADLEEFDGWEWQAAWDKVAFGIKHWDQIEQIAVVGTKRWESLSAAAADKIMNAEVRFFPVDKRGQALDWVVESPNPNT